MGRVLTIAAGAPFVDVLAERLLAAAAPQDLPRWTVLMPNRRACQSLTEAFLRVSDGRTVLLPRLLALGDVEEDSPTLWPGGAEATLPPAIPPHLRRFLLARLVSAFRAAIAQPVSADQAVALADALADLLDQFQTDRVSLAELATVVPEEHASHWQQTIDLLAIIAEHWPVELDRLGMLDPVDRRNRLLTAQAAAWRASPPADPIIVAGSTGSIPASADLITTVAHLPLGEVILPGLDLFLGEEDWEAVRDDPTHPHYGLLRLLDRIGITPRDVERLGPPPSPRAALASLALLPALRTQAWRTATLGASVAESLAGLSRIDAAGPAEEATAIALALREVLEVPGRTGCLITPDRGLARRVAAELRRYGEGNARLEIDDSAGRPLHRTRVGVFLGLIAGLTGGRVQAVPLLALLKHPLAGFGYHPAELRRAARLLERKVLRGPRLAGHLSAWRQAIATITSEAQRLVCLDLLERVEQTLAPILTLGPSPPHQIADALVRAAEAAAATASDAGADRLWREEDGEAARHLLADLIALDLPEVELDPVTATEVGDLMQRLMADVAVRPRWGGQARLKILGPIEARLVRADVVILAGLTEGIWPAPPPLDPWLGRALRDTVGLSPMDRRIGQAAHDVAQALAGERVILSRSRRVDGADTVPSRWLQRLEAVLVALGGPSIEEAPYSGWVAALDEAATVVAASRPNPCPPLDWRPTSLSVTQVETLMRDPYAVYARHILRLEALDPIDAEIDAAIQGTVIHEILERFVRAHPNQLPADPAARLIELAEQEFTDASHRPEVVAFWRPKIHRLALWVAAQEQQRRADTLAIATEVTGCLEIARPGRPAFTIKATADRVEHRRDGSIAIIDYKTGSVPKPEEVRAGYAPQLPLEAVIAAAGGFTGIPAAPVTELAFWKLGGREGGRDIPAIKPEKGEDPAAALSAAIAAARVGVEGVITAFDDPSRCYTAQPRPDTAPRYNDYRHLARTAEWATGSDG
ncbi:MAG: double-strand break repair protein AddB [Alphaproteobacteria bacterium]|nr:double-strand break repair protein AddB [Alphaproteobacteria bacterium]